ncbi:hypothetical protein CcCBS67573_g05084 [Chytriomyces confervae]|uniref:Uncharacterized protein n=1 Tax=Chytriomyces confervae TaxID=246404 RepID=A0A507FBI1_9FUNG|nr:hypothetical protein CcCBS67573_g05084 [Chytriomyces confervae]
MQLDFTAIALGLSLDVGINTIGFIYSAIHRTEHYYDACGTGSFVAATVGTAIYRLVVGRGALRLSQVLVAASTTVQVDHSSGFSFSASNRSIIWAARLFKFLTARVKRLGRDSRFDKVKDKPVVFSGYWAVQALWVAVVCFPTLATIASSSDASSSATVKETLLLATGFALWIFGFAFEVIADNQKAQWQNRLGSARAKAFIDTGLWARCRYPNYFGEITLWFGSYLMALSCFPNSTVAKYAFAVSPLFITFILTNLSGIPIQEGQARKRFKGNSEYAHYVKTTPLLVPRLLSAKASKQS